MTDSEFGTVITVKDSKFGRVILENLVNLTTSFEFWNFCAKYDQFQVNFAMLEGPIWRFGKILGFVATFYQETVPCGGWW